MIRAPNLAYRLARILLARGKVADFFEDVQVLDDAEPIFFDGEVVGRLPPKLIFWNSAKLGPEPTQGEVDAASEEPIPPPDVNDFQNQPKWFRAKCISDLAFRLSKPPGQLTSVEILTERQRIKNIADALE